VLHSLLTVPAVGTLLHEPTGDQGTGFYKDSPLHLRTKAAAPKAKPVLLKSSSIVKGLQRKPGSLPDAKKRKTGRHQLHVWTEPLLGGRAGRGRGCVAGRGCLAHTAPGWCLLTATMLRQRMQQSHAACPACPLSTQVSHVPVYTPDKESSNKPAYLKEMDKYHAMNCSSASGDRPLVK
jgi:hypothetical protein